MKGRLHSCAWSVARCDQHAAWVRQPASPLCEEKGREYGARRCIILVNMGVQLTRAYKEEDVEDDEQDTGDLPAHVETDLRHSATSGRPRSSLSKRAHARYCKYKPARPRHFT